MFNQREFNSDHPRSNFQYQRAKDHPAQLPLVRSGPPAPVKNHQYVPQDQRNFKTDQELRSSGTDPELGSSGTGPGYAAELETSVPSRRKIQYKHEFLLSLQFSSACLQKPDGLPFIPEVVLDKSQSEPRIEPRIKPRRILPDVFKEDVQLNQAANAWRPGLKKASQQGEEKREDPEAKKTQEMLGCFRSILNKLTPQMFDRLIQRVNELDINSEERLRGVIDLVFEKAVREPHFSETYAKMCHCLVNLKVPTSENPAVDVGFRTLLLRCCQKEFQKNKDDEIVAAKRKQLNAATETEERQQLKEELEEAENKARRRSLGNIKLVGELFKLKMLADSIMHQCIAKLLNDNAEESLECLSKLLSTIGKDIDEKDKTRMDQYVIQIDDIIRARKSSTRIRFMLQDVLDLRRNKWVPRRAVLGPKTIDQIHEEAKMEDQEPVLQQFGPKKNWTCGPKNTNITKPEERSKYSPVFTQTPKAVKQSTEGPVGLPKIPDIVLEEAVLVTEAPSVLESVPSALELKEELKIEAEDELAEEAFTPVDQTPPSAPVDQTVTVEPETTEETVVYTDDVMTDGVSSAPESNSTAPESSGIPYKKLITGGLIISGLCCSGLLLYHGAKLLLKLL